MSTHRLTHRRLNDQYLGVRLPAELMSALEREAEKRFTTMAQLARLAIARQLEAEKGEAA